MKITSIKQIPTFTRMPTSRIEIPLTHVRRWLNDVEDLGQPVVLSPKFQRGIVWKKDQQTAFIEYIMRGGQSARDIYWNCADYNSASKAPMVLVDGQQRLSALLAFLTNKIPAFGSLYKEFIDRKLVGRKTLVFNINTLETEAEVIQWYLELNTTGVAHSKSEIKKAETLLQKEIEPFNGKGLK